MQRATLLRVLGVGFGVAVAIGNTIGAGILRSPADVATHLPTVGLYLLAWIAGGVYALLGANAIAELGATLPESGGQYVFARHALGPYAGFVVGWNDWISTCGSVAAVAIVFGEYGAKLAGLSGAWSTGAISAAAIAAFTILLLRGVRTGSRTQTITSALKVLVFAALIVLCLTHIGAGEHATTTMSAPAAVTLAGAIGALQAVIYTYDGWTGVVYFSEEVENPGRDVPRALFGGVLSVMAIYLLVNLSYLAVLPLRAIASDPLPAAAAARAVVGPAGDTIVRVIVLVSLLSAINALLLMASRVFFAMSRDGLGAAKAAEVDGRGTPVASMLAGSAVALLFLLTGTFERVIAIMSFFFVATYTISFTALFALRRREPDRPRPFRAWGHPFTTGLALVVSVAFLIGAVAGDRRGSLWALGILAVSWPIYRWMGTRT